MAGIGPSSEDKVVNKVSMVLAPEGLVLITNGDADK